MKPEDEREPEGGSYTIGKDGTRRRTEKPTEVPAGGGARDKDGKLLTKDEPPENNMPAQPAPPARKPWEAPVAAKAEPAADAAASSSSGAADKKGKA